MNIKITPCAPAAVRILILSVMALCHIPGVFAQSAALDREYMAEKVREHTIIASESNRNIIPSNILYRVALSRILLSKDKAISETDHQLIGEMLSPLDSRFKFQDLNDIASICNSFDTQFNEVGEIARRYALSRSQSYSRLDEYYERAVSGLSSEAATYVLERVKELATNESGLGYSELDWIGLSENYPDVANELLSRQCEKTRGALANLVREQVTLGDEIKAVIISEIDEADNN